MKTNIKFIDLFAGIGGFRYGLKKAGKEYQSKISNTKGDVSNTNGGELSHTFSNPFTCVYTNEWNKYARQIYKKHWGKCDGRDIREVPTDEIPGHDLLCGGFPCQSFSIAGKRKGFQDTRGTLFWEICRIIKDKRPSYLLLENVKGLLSHQNGWTFATILLSLDDLGYNVQWQVLNSKNFSVPQNRERVFIIGHLRGQSRPKVFPIKGTSGNDIKYKRFNRTQQYRTIKPDGISPTLASNTTFDKWNVETDKVKIRKLTPTECERLQGFPDNWTEGISNTQRYKCLGNAVTTNVITAIGNKFIKLLKAEWDMKSE